MQKRERRRRLLNGRLRQGVVEAAQESAPVELRPGELVGSARLVERITLGGRANHAQCPIGSLRDSAQLVGSVAALERRVDDLALGDRVAGRTHHGECDRIRPDGLHALAHALAGERERADAAAADDVQNDTVPADQDDEVGQGCAQGLGHAHFTPEIEGKFLDPGPIFGFDRVAVADAESHGDGHHTGR